MRAFWPLVIVAGLFIPLTAAFDIVEFGQDEFQEQHYVFRTEEDMKAFAQSLVPVLPDELSLIEEINKKSFSKKIQESDENEEEEEEEAHALFRKPRFRVAATTPTKKPTKKPTMKPTKKPTKKPTRKPTTRPTLKSTSRPTKKPTVKPTLSYTTKPTKIPTNVPNAIPTAGPSKLSSKPSARPSFAPTTVQTSSVPTVALTSAPSARPSSVAPSATPTVGFPVAVYSRPISTKFTGSNRIYVGALAAPLGNKMTISLWINSTTSGTIACYSRSASSVGQFVFGVGGSGALAYWESNSQGYGMIINGVAKVATGQRVYVAIVKDGGTARFFVNGVLDAQGSTSNVVTPDNVAFNLGNDDAGSYYFKGWMEYLNAYNVALTADEVFTLYNNYVHPPTMQPSQAPTAMPTAPTCSPSHRPSTAPTPMPPTQAVVVAGADRAPLLGFQLIDALAAGGDSRNLTGDALRQTYVTMADTLASVRSDVLAKVLTNASTGAQFNSISWTLGHDSVTLDIADNGNTVPLFVSNYNYAGGSDGPKTLAAVGFFEDAGRFAAFGVNPFVSSANAFTNMKEIVQNLVTWMNKGVNPAATSNFQITIAHLPGPSSYWFNHDSVTHNWFKAAFPQASINNVNACDNSRLDACLTLSQLLVIGRQMDRSDDSATPETSTDVAQVSAAVESFLKRGGSVIYVHYYRNGNTLSNALFKLFGLAAISSSTNGNYWTQAGLKDANPFAPLASSTDSLYAAMQTLMGVTPLTAADQCTDNNWNGCSNAGFLSKIASGSLYLKALLGSFDSSGVDLFSTALNKNVLEKILVLLGDKYRTDQGATDPGTPLITYPWVKTDNAALAAMVFADSAVLYRRKTQPAQTNMGTVYCSYRSKLLGPDGCADYKNFATKVQRFQNLLVQDEGIYSSDVWTTAGVFALPGVPFTVKRVDNRADVRVYVAMWYQRSGTTKSFDLSSSGVSQYNRPQFLRTTEIFLANDTEVTLSTPFGGPVYFGVQNVGTRTSDGPIACVFSNVAKHSALMDVGNSSMLAAFPEQIKNNPIPIVDIKAPSVELHMRSDYFLGQLRVIDFMQNYSGPSGTSKLLEDLRFNFLESQLTLAGLKVPGKKLAESLPASNQAACRALGWNCTDERIHTRRGIQHANYDERAQCGNGCSGNPFDMDWSITPLGWGEAHELGHNMQIGVLQIAWLPAGADRDKWSNYQNRATENSNNIFPYYNKWRFFRVVKGYTGVVPDGWNGHQHDFYALQSAYARVNTTMGGVRKTVTLDGSCKVVYSYPLGTSVARVAQDAVYANGAYAADNDHRMAFYLQLSFIMQNKSVAGVPLSSGFEIFTLLYQGARIFYDASSSDAQWRATRDQLGFGIFNRTCATTHPCYAVYGTSGVSSITGNDFVLVMLTFLTGYDWRPHYDVRGLFYSSLAQQQVEAHIAAGRADKGPIPTDYYSANDFPPADLLSAPTVKLPIDGQTAYPFNNWSVAKCNMPA